MATSVLGEVQTALDQSGLQDVKFFFSLELNAKLNSDVERDVADALNAYVTKQFKAMPAIGDKDCLNQAH